MAKTPGLPTEAIAAMDVAPDLMLYALEAASDRQGRRRQRGAVSEILDAYMDYHGLDLGPDDVLEPEDLLAMAALASRVSALSDIIEHGNLSDHMLDEGRHMAVIEAACSATLIERDGRPTFQLLDFLARVERAAAAAK